MNHTPGIWGVFNGYLIRSVIENYAVPIAEMRAPYRPNVGIVRGEHEQWENARRIVACVNACAGIPNEVLLTVGAFGGFGRDQMVQHVSKQRDELLALLEQCVEYWVPTTGNLPVEDEMIGNYCQAIASVKGGA